MRQTDAKRDSLHVRAQPPIMRHGVPDDATRAHHLPKLASAVVSRHGPDGRQVYLLDRGIYDRPREIAGLHKLGRGRHNLQRVKHLPEPRAVRADRRGRQAQRMTRRQGLAHLPPRVARCHVVRLVNDEEVTMRHHGALRQRRHACHLHGRERVRPCPRRDDAVRHAGRVERRAYLRHQLTPMRHDHDPAPLADGRCRHVREDDRLTAAGRTDEERRPCALLDVTPHGIDRAHLIGT